MFRLPHIDIFKCNKIQIVKFHNILCNTIRFNLANDNDNNYFE